MLDIVQFSDGRYGVQNQLTGIILPDQRWWHRRHVATFRTVKGAVKHRRRVNRRLAKVIGRMSRRL